LSAVPISREINLLNYTDNPVNNVSPLDISNMYQLYIYQLIYINTTYIVDGLLIGL